MTAVVEEKKKRGRPAKSKAEQQEEKAPLEVKMTQEKSPYPTLEELGEMPLKTYEDYLNYNDKVRERRRFLRKKDVEFLYAPNEIVPSRKVRLTRTHNMNQPINLRIKLLKHAVKFESPKEGYKHGEEVVVPEMVIDKINSLAEPKYKQITYPDGRVETVLDYMDNKYSCQYVSER